MKEPESRPMQPCGDSNAHSGCGEDNSAEGRFHALVRLTRRLTDTHELQELLPLVVREVLSVLKMERGVLLLDEGAGGYEAVVSCDNKDSGAYSPTDQDATRALFEEVKATRRPVIPCSRKASEGDSSFWNLGTVVGLPLLDRSRFLGVLCLDSATKHIQIGGDGLPAYLAFLESVAAVAALAVTNARAHTRMLEAQKLSEDFGNLFDLDEVFDRALSRIVQLTRAEQGFLFIRGPTGQLEQRVGLDRKGRYLPESEDRFVSKRIIRAAAETGEVILSDNVAEVDAFGGSDGSVIRLGLTSILCVPIRGRDSTLGVVYLENRLLIGVFDEEEKRLVQLVADRAGTAIEAAKLLRQQRDILRALANAVEARDVGTSSHVQRVSHFAIAVGHCLGLPNEQLMLLEQSALLHDIGKIGIPDRVLLKQGPLCEEEWRLMKEHPQLGVGIVSPVDLPKEVLDGILYHQEAWNGRGYPFGLSGENIPLFGRIIAVVDAFDAITTDRPYRKARTIRQAADELSRCAGEQFDPEVVWAFLSVLNEAMETDTALRP
ncbi:MAG TPA: GAF domain-containing protein [Polyangiaceae bacterium]|nr:MAG: Cyclic di-GMP phosphodiesterase response regulator RpfG [Deltaproteobacteria bacterium ADurb.Bin207]HNS98507.1 GAF domain-containing protein [Polyangiaceae bacterium]HNZ23947.1 GAF domain-containing protein [Polyangiaceae bacterium]HOD21802.1 GAF domain-containing protein [Polyangiaceae bacterium]HOE49512.1 GAF domain-containing protein [Polyangiaceae bacterium]